MKSLHLLSLALSLTLAACGAERGDQPAPEAAAGAGGAAATSYLLAQDVPDAVPILTALEGSDGAQIAVVGKVQRKVKGRAIFFLTDASVEDCTRTGEQDHCKTPWDYCCREKEMKRSTMLIELRGPDGQPARLTDLGIRELDLVAVRGTLAKTEGGRLMLLAQDGWYLRDRPKVSSRVKFPD